MTGPHPDPLALDQNLEPAAVATMGTVCEAVLMASIAVSLKRIADALTQCDQYGDTGSAAITNAIRDGLREGR